MVTSICSSINPKEQNIKNLRPLTISKDYETDSASSSFSSCVSSSSSSDFDSAEYYNLNWNFLEEDLEEINSTLALQTEMESIQVIEGYLDRKEDNGLFPKWSRSFYRLCGSKLFYSDENMIIINYIDLLRVKAVHNGSPKSLKFCIEDFSGHKYSLRAMNDTMKLYWTVKIRSVALLLQKEIQKSTNSDQCVFKKVLSVTTC